MGEAQFLLHADVVSLDRLGAEIQSLGDLARGAPLAEEAKDLETEGSLDLAVSDPGPGVVSVRRGLEFV